MLLTDQEVAKVLTVSRSTVWNWTKTLESFPQPIKIGGATRWREEDIWDFVNAGAKNDGK